MKKTVKIMCIALIAILVAVMIISNFSSAQTTAKLTTSSSVNAGDTFDVTFSIQPGAISLSFSMEYDSSVFEYSDYVKQDGLIVNPNFNSSSDDKKAISLFYVDETNSNGNSSLKSIDKVTIKFKAKDVTEETNGNIVVNDDFSAVVKENGDNNYSEIVYENIDKSGLSKSITVKPKKEPESGDIKLSDNEIYIKVNETKQVTVTNGVTNISWGSSDSSIATVDNNGNIKGISEGDATITAYNDDKTAKVIVHVTSADNPDNGNPVLSDTNITVKKDEKKTITADRKVTWSSSDESIAKVDPNTGEVTGVSKGTTTIIAKDENGKTSTCTVTVTDDNNGNNNGNNGNNNGGNNGNYNGTTNIGNTSVRNASSSANEVVPATGESSVGTIALLAIIALIVASIIFKRKSKIK